MDTDRSSSYGGAVTTPDPYRPARDDDKTVVVPTGNRQPQRQDPYGQQQPWSAAPGGFPPGSYQQPPGPAQGYYDQPTTNLAYNPYGQQPYPDPSQYPAAFPGEIPPVRRPGSLFFALLLHLLSTLPFLGAAAAILIGGAAILSMIPAEQLAEFQTLVGVDVVGLVFGFAVFVGVLALLFVLLSILAVAGRNWARILVTVMTVFFVLLNGFWTVIYVGGAAAGQTLAAGEFLIGLAIIAGPGVLALIGTILMFLPAANRFYASRRR